MKRKKDFKALKESLFLKNRMISVINNEIKEIKCRINLTLSFILKRKDRNLQVTNIIKTGSL